jgi:hypothetical protein
MPTAACEIRYWLDGMLDFACQKAEVLYRQEIDSLHHHQDTSVAHDIDEDNEGWHHAPKDHRKHDEGPFGLVIHRARWVVGLDRSRSLAVPGGPRPST